LESGVYFEAPHTHQLSCQFRAKNLRLFQLLWVFAFFIGHNPRSADKWVAARQAKWLEKVLGEEHERDKKHSDRIELPD
jgi:hypothetical protein